MKPTSVQTWVRSGVAAAVVVVAVVVAAPGAWAGGWAVSTLDAVPAAVAGTSADVGFTIRQHGVTPANPDGEVGVSIRSADGTETFFAGVPEGRVGHYVARVRFPAPGSYQWAIRQGWFAAQDLGPLTVTAATAVRAAGSVGDPSGAVTGNARPGGTTGSEYRWPLTARVLLPVIGLGLGAFAVVDAVQARKRRSRELVAT
jgi:hypothetical protein